jgi:hypothetical protein
MEYYRDSQFLVWFEDDLVWYKFHHGQIATGYDFFSMKEVKKKLFQRYEPNSKIFEGQEAINRYKYKIREIKINNLLNDIL